MHFTFDSTFGPLVADRPIFIVESGGDGRASFLQALREAGAKNPCRFLSTGEEMIEALLEVLRGAPPPLLCFFDVLSPGMGGLDVLKWIRLQDALAEVSVVMLFAAGDSVSLNEVLRCGAQCCTDKFPPASQLREILSEAVKFSSVASGHSAFNLPCNLLRAAAPAVS